MFSRSRVKQLVRRSGRRRFIFACISLFALYCGFLALMKSGVGEQVFIKSHTAVVVNGVPCDVMMSLNGKNFFVHVPYDRVYYVKGYQMKMAAAGISDHTPSVLFFHQGQVALDGTDGKVDHFNAHLTRTEHFITFWTMPVRGKKPSYRITIDL